MRKSTVLAVFLVTVVGLVCQYLALIWSPPEKAMGNLVRIMYFHVGSAWIAFLAFFVTAIFSVVYLMSRKLMFDRMAVASAEVGIVYTSVTLVTGSLWAKPIWNTWWTWDPRLTTTLILWFLYVGYMLLRGTIEGVERRARVSGILGIISFVDVPIVHFAVEWWRSIHPQVIDDSGVNLPGSMLFTLMFSFLTFFFIYVAFVTLRTRQETQKQRLFVIRQGIQELRAKAFNNQLEGDF
jgi:heme exporter protein C